MRRLAVPGIGRSAPRGVWPRWAGALVIAVTCGAAQADADALRQQLVQKIKLAAQLIADAATAQRIAASGNEQAQASLDAGRVHLAQAQTLLSSGDLAGAQQSVDSSLRQIGVARRLVPDGPQKVAAARQRHDQLLASTERLLQAYRARAQADKGHDVSDLAAAEGLVGDARHLAADGGYERASEALARAERHLLAGMSRLLQSNTLDYTARFESPAQEFDHEWARYKSIADLVPLAVADLQPRREALAVIERYAETAKALSTLARRKAESGQHPQALQGLRSATLYLQRALTAAGLTTPAE